MKVEVVGDLSTLTEPVRLDARTVVLRDDYNQPFLVAQVLDNGHVFVSRAGDRDFHDTLKSLGVDIKVNYRNVGVSP